MWLYVITVAKGHKSWQIHHVFIISHQSVYTCLRKANALLWVLGISPAGLHFQMSLFAILQKHQSVISSNLIACENLRVRGVVSEHYYS